MGGEGKKNSPRKNDRNVDAVGRSRMDFAVSSRVRACGGGPVYTYIHACISIAQPPAAARSNGRVSKRECVKRARRPIVARQTGGRVAENRCPFHALHAIAYIYVYIYIKSIVASKRASFSAPLYAKDWELLSYSSHATMITLILLFRYFIGETVAPISAIALCTCSVYIVYT